MQKKNNNRSSDFRTSYFKFPKAFTLIEILVAVGLFSIVVGITSGFFVSAIKIQRKSLAMQELSDQTSYVMEYMSRALRMAKKQTAALPPCLSSNGLNYETFYWYRGIRFINYKGECQEFYRNPVSAPINELKGGVTTPLTSDDLVINTLQFSIQGEDQTDQLQPRVTIFLDISGKEGTNIKIQTTISQRELDVQY
jgi:prepilin-type N-terminal cleavage/methylation domain-containing protein